ncbi:hypothetical protein HYN48_09780 [Flavobacterium magnum]|uniref:Uncharacterized protein n=1 Tax=Flavobacterium magnum TaxID=2162713 RepID=A0A2S0RFC1_9FLAO|nr:hypothetical protein [Flavobacterium magnum]AWA30354.1 hypothetical protein HYN48_09780 [Flavobacterium magnum]
MDKETFCEKLTRLHFILLMAALLNFSARKVIGFSLTHELSYILNVSVYLTGIVTFFKLYFSRFRKIVIYFSFYLISMLSALFFFMMGGIFWAVIVTITAYPVWHDAKVINKNDLVVYEDFQGFLGSCCNYTVSEKCLIFEKRLGLIKTDGEDLNEENYSLIGVKGDALQIRDMNANEPSGYIYFEIK